MHTQEIQVHNQGVNNKCSADYIKHMLVEDMSTKCTNSTPVYSSSPKFGDPLL